MWSTTRTQDDAVIAMQMQREELIQRRNEMKRREKEDRVMSFFTRRHFSVEKSHFINNVSYNKRSTDTQFNLLPVHSTILLHYVCTTFRTGYFFLDFD